MECSVSGSGGGGSDGAKIADAFSVKKHCQYLSDLGQFIVSKKYKLKS